jgi:Holliday junction resolvase-like predicted endonuclease
MAHLIDTREIGSRFEDRALLYYQAAFKDLRVLEKNFNARVGEIDWICEVRASEGAPWELLFVEVRARQVAGLSPAEDTVTRPKRRRLLRTIELFLASYRGPAKSVRIEVLAWNVNHWDRFELSW